MMRAVRLNAKELRARFEDEGKSRIVRGKRTASGAEAMRAVFSDAVGRSLSRICSKAASSRGHRSRVRWFRAPFTA